MRPPFLDDERINGAVDAVRRAAVMARRIERELVSPALSKDDRSPVTVADFAVQAFVANVLAEFDPEVDLVAEERADALRDDQEGATLDEITRFVGSEVEDASRTQVLELIDRGAGEPESVYWTLDPIDGTKGFLRGDQYAVALGLIRDGEVAVGLLGCPELVEGHRPQRGGLGTLIAAVREQGAWMTALEETGRPDDWQRMCVSTRSQPDEARLLRSVESAHTNTGATGEFLRVLGVEAPAVPLDSQAKYAVLASGHGDMMVRMLSSSRPDYREKIWDQAAGSIIIEEAGGRVTDLDGKALDFSHRRTLAQNRGVLATNGLLHDCAIGALREIGA